MSKIESVIMRMRIIEHFGQQFLELNWLKANLIQVFL